MGGRLLGRAYSISVPTRTARAPGPNHDDLGTQVDSGSNSHSGTTRFDGEGDDGSGPAERFGMLVGAVLGIVLAGWAFFGPGHILELFRYELPVVASFRQPVPLAFFGYAGALTFAFAFVGAIAFPIVRPNEANAYGGHDEIAGYEWAFAKGLVGAIVAIALAIALLGVLVPAGYHVVTGRYSQALIMGLVAGAMVAGGYWLWWVATVGFRVATVPILVPAYVGARLGSVVRERGGIGPDPSPTEDRYTIPEGNWGSERD
ncbi:hypothetical protein Hrd1104_10565 [Halorhabdus sp. CBA1104]|uniref:hypothetical protein n=1 Tax=Halorhabdus sp. CBA1104 TaxID=1380432 RepID=UPI0012B21F68|nr:hypothetical protein [Halorhabdus sp. CBA1104]QGN07697.1 hypothetical protein Hrd1104_10565 [Halorhabdus sp. CBA1104]